VGKPLSGAEKVHKLNADEHRHFFIDAHRECVKYQRLARKARRVALKRRLRREGE
jgi:hypothetical protein